VSPVYADDEVVDGHILMHKIFPIIDRCRFGLYEISETNRPNVFLELGYAKGRGKPCYLLLRQGEKPPSNLAGCDRVDYESYRHLTEKLRGLFEVWRSH